MEKWNEKKTEKKLKAFHLNVRDICKKFEKKSKKCNCLFFPPLNIWLNCSVFFFFVCFVFTYHEELI